MNAHVLLNLLNKLGKKSNAMLSGAGPGFLDRGFIFIKLWWFALRILSYTDGL